MIWDNTLMNDDDLRNALLGKLKEIREQINRLQDQARYFEGSLRSLPNQPELPKMPPTNPGANGHVNIFEAVGKAIDVAPPEFTVKDITHLVEQSLPKDQKPAKDTISSALWRIAKERNLQGKLDIKQKGSGRKPTIYVKK